MVEFVKKCANLSTNKVTHFNETGCWYNNCTTVIYTVSDLFRNLIQALIHIPTGIYTNHIFRLKLCAGISVW